MPEMIVKALRLPYGGKTHRRGARFNASSRDARVLSLIGKADYVTAELQSEPSSASTPAARPRRQYRRRDMQAEG